MAALNFTFKDLFQWAFALSPFPSYLPQYFSIMQQLSADGSSSPSSGDNGLMLTSSSMGDGSFDVATAAAASAAAAASSEHRASSIKRSYGDLRKRNLHDTTTTTTTTAIAAPPISDGAIMAGLQLHGTPSKLLPHDPPNHGGGIHRSLSGSFEESNNNNFLGTPTNATNVVDSNNKLDTGLSRATVLLLLSAHLLRLLYFHGLILEESQAIPPIASAGDELEQVSTTTKATTTAAAAAISAASTTSALQWDLLGQSLSMIVVQLMLLHATMLVKRRKSFKRRSGADLAAYKSTESLLTASNNHTMNVDAPPRSDSFVLSSSSTLGSGDHRNGYNHHNNNNSNSSSNNNNNLNNNNNISNNNSSSSILRTLTTPSYWQTKWRQFSFRTTSHLQYLFSPYNILQSHSFCEYLELLFISSMVVKVVFDYHWYPLYRMQVVLGLKHTSIAMESCLALPQMIRNYRNETTEGLSVVMVVGWVAGDFFKLCYFLFSMIGTGDSGNEGHNGPINNNNNVFALGCLLSIFFDSIVGIQMAWWYPQPAAAEWKRRILRSVRHWKTNKDDNNAGEPLILNNGQKKKVGGAVSSLCRSLLITLIQWARGVRPPSNSS